MTEGRMTKCLPCQGTGWEGGLQDATEGCFWCGGTGEVYNYFWEKAETSVLNTSDSDSDIERGENEGLKV
jgi:hypothetical protein